MGCEYESECPKKLEDRKPFILRWMTDRFLDNGCNVNYKYRLSISESINGFYKTSNGIIKFIGTKRNAVDNECDLRNAIYNLTCFQTFLEEGY